MDEILGPSPENLDDDKKFSDKGENITSSKDQIIEKKIDIIPEEDKKDTSIKTDKDAMSEFAQQTSPEKEDLSSEVISTSGEAQRVYSREERKNLTGEELKKAIIADMKKFLSSERIRPAPFWDKNSLESTRIVAEEILRTEVNNIETLSKMVDYFYKVNGEVPFISDRLLTLNECLFSDKETQKIYQKNKKTYQQMREKIISKMLTMNVNLNNLVDRRLFIHIYHMITPKDMTSMTVFQSILNIVKYGFNYVCKGDIPDEMKPKDVVSYIRNKLRKMCKLQGIKFVIN